MSSEFVHTFHVRNINSCFDLISPAITYRHLFQPIQPSESKIEPLLRKDDLTSSDGPPMLRLLLSYSYTRRFFLIKFLNVS